MDEAETSTVISSVKVTDVDAEADPSCIRAISTVRSGQSEVWLRVNGCGSVRVC